MWREEVALQADGQALRRAEDVVGRQSNRPRCPIHCFHHQLSLPVPLCRHDLPGLALVFLRAAMPVPLRSAERRNRTVAAPTMPGSGGATGDRVASWVCGEARERGWVRAERRESTKRG